MLVQACPPLAWSLLIALAAVSTPDSAGAQADPAPADAASQPASDEAATLPHALPTTPHAVDEPAAIPEPTAATPASDDVVDDELGEITLLEHADWGVRAETCEPWASWVATRQR